MTTLDQLQRQRATRIGTALTIAIAIGIDISLHAIGAMFVVGCLLIIDRIIWIIDDTLNIHSLERRPRIDLHRVNSVRTVQCREFLCLPEDNPSHYDNNGRHYLVAAPPKRSEPS